MKTWTYVIQCWTDDDFSQEYKGECYYSEFIAKDVAEEYYNQDPGDPEDFEVHVGVKSPEGVIEWFNVRAFMSIGFRARNIT